MTRTALSKTTRSGFRKPIHAGQDNLPLCSATEPQPRRRTALPRSSFGPKHAHRGAGKSSPGCSVWTLRLGDLRSMRGPSAVVH